MEPLSESPKPPPSRDLSSPDLEAARLREAIADLQTRVTALERGVAASSPAIPAAPPEETGAGFGLAFINRIGAITLAIGIIFFFKYAVDNQWIGSAGRVLLGLVAGLLLIAAAEWLRSQDQRVFAQGLGGCGLGTLYISTYAALAYYHLVSQTTGFCGLISVCAIGVLLSIRDPNSAIAALGFMGALLTPVLLHNTLPDVRVDFPYILLVALTSVIISVRERWIALIPTIAALAIIVGLILFEPAHASWFAALSLCLSLIYWIAALRSRAAPRLANWLYVVGHACFVLGILRLMGFWVPHHITPADRDSVLSELGSVSLALYGIVALTYGILQRSRINRGLGLVLTGIVIAKLYLWDVWLLARFYRITAFIALGVLLLVASYIYSQFKSRVSPRAN